MEEGVLSKNNSQGFVVLKQVFTEGGVQRERYGIVPCLYEIFHNTNTC